MSAVKLRRMARDEIRETDGRLRLWQEAFGRGDVDVKEASLILDALLELRSASTLTATPAAEKPNVVEKSGGTGLAS